MMAGRQSRRAIFLDRDGVINEMVYRPNEGIKDSPWNPSEFELLPGVADAVRIINEMSFFAIIVSNQPGIGKGKLGLEDLEAINHKLRDNLRLAGAYLDEIYYCLHHPNAIIDKYRIECECRKPKSGLLIKAATDFNIDLVGSYMIGDNVKDIIAGNNVGCTTFLLDGLSQEKVVGKEDAARPDFKMANLIDAIEYIRLNMAI